MCLHAPCTIVPYNIRAKHFAGACSLGKVAGVGKRRREWILPFSCIRACRACDCTCLRATVRACVRACTDMRRSSHYTATRYDCSRHRMPIAVAPNSNFLIYCRCGMTPRHEEITRRTTSSTALPPLKGQHHRVQSPSQSNEHSKDWKR